MHKNRLVCHIFVLSTLIIVLLSILVIYLLANPITQTKTKEIEKRVVIEVEKEPTYVYNITSEEREMLARLVYLEANIESFECQKGIVSVVINRWQDGRWGDTLEEVIYAKNQFSPSNLIYKTTPTEINYQAVDEVLKNGSIFPKYIMFFRASYGFSSTWSRYREYRQISDTYFGYFEADKTN